MIGVKENRKRSRRPAGITARRPFFVERFIAAVLFGRLRRGGKNEIENVIRRGAGERYGGSVARGHRADRKGGRCARLALRACGALFTLRACGAGFALRACGPLFTLRTCGTLFTLRTCGPLFALRAFGAGLALRACGTGFTLRTCGPLFTLRTCGPLFALRTCGPLFALRARGTLFTLRAFGAGDQTCAARDRAAASAVGGLRSGKAVYGRGLVQQVAVQGKYIFSHQNNLLSN